MQGASKGEGERERGEKARGKEKRGVYKKESGVIKLTKTRKPV